MPVPRAVESGLMRAAGEHPDRGDYFGALGYGELKINSAPASLTGTAIMSLPSSVDIELVSTFPAVK